MNLKEKNYRFKYIFIGIICIIVLCIIVILINKNKKQSYFLEIIGDPDIVINQYDNYIDTGFKAYDNHKNDLSNEVIITGEVNPAVVGEYTITYQLKDIIKKRTVAVISSIKQTTYLVLSGETTMFLKVGEIYQEPGYTVIDSLEDNLTDKVIVEGNVNTQKVGTYKLKYTITNQSNITITKERTIIVMDTAINLSYTPTKITNQDVTININVTDNYFDYLTLPNNEKINQRNTTYVVNKNGKYKFTIYSKDGSKKEQTVNITNIDKQSPTGTCSGYYQNGKSYITINANDSSGIAKYQINNQTFSTKQVTYNQELKNVTIQIHDNANNYSTISCQLKNKNTLYPPYFGVKTYTDNSGNTMSYWLYIPENATDNMPMIIFLHGGEEYGNDFKNGTAKAITWGPGADIKMHNAKFNAIILMPQSIGQWPAYILKTVINLSDKIANDYKVDKQRISISGFSMGCVAISEMLSIYPNYFSATVPIECHRDVTDSYAKYYVNTPTWTFASQDYTNEIAKNMATNINNQGGNAKYTTYPYLGHTGLVGYNNYSIFTDQGLNLVNWMTSQRRK